MRQLAFLFVLILISSCRTNKDTVAKSDNKDNTVFIENEIDLVVNYSFDSDQLNNTFRAILKQQFKEDIDQSINGFDIHLSPLDTASITIDDYQISTALPVNVIIDRSTRLLGDLSYSGTAELYFKTQIQIDNSNQLISETLLEDYKWLENPRFSIFNFDLGVKSLSNFLFKRNKQKLEIFIDQSIQSQFDLKKIRSQIVEKLARIESVPGLNELKLVLQLESIDIGPFSTRDSVSYSQLGVKLNSFVVNKKSDFKAFDFLINEINFKKPGTEQSQIHCLIQTREEQLNKLIALGLDGKTFEREGRSIIVKSSKTSISDQKLFIDLKLDGDFKGDLQMQAVPVLDRATQQLGTAEFDISIKSNSMVQNAALIFLKSKIKESIRQSLELTLSEQIDSIEQYITDLFKQYFSDEDLDFVFSVEEIRFDHLIIEEDMLLADLKAEIYLQLNLKNFEFLLD